MQSSQDMKRTRQDLKYILLTTLIYKTMKKPRMLERNYSKKDFALFLIFAIVIHHRKHSLKVQYLGICSLIYL